MPHGQKGFICQECGSKIPKTSKKCRKCGSYDIDLSRSTVKGELNVH